jgi:hypothetical protein
VGDHSGFIWIPWQFVSLEGWIGMSDAVLTSGIDDPRKAESDEVLLYLDCGSLLPISSGQPAGRRMFRDDVSL